MYRWEIDCTSRRLSFSSSSSSPQLTGSLTSVSRKGSSLRFIRWEEKRRECLHVLEERNLMITLPASFKRRSTSLIGGVEWFVENMIISSSGLQELRGSKQPITRTGSSLSISAHSVCRVILSPLTYDKPFPSLPLPGCSKEFERQTVHRSVSSWRDEEDGSSNRVGSNSEHVKTSSDANKSSRTGRKETRGRSGWW